MRRRISVRLGLGLCFLTILWFTAHLAPLTTAAAADKNRLVNMATQVAVSSFDKAPVLVPGQTVTDSVDETTALRSYRFEAKSGEQYRIAVALTDGNYFTSVSVVSADLIHVLGESDGADLIDSSLHFAIPADATYGVIVSYIAPSSSTPMPGKYTIVFTQVEPKPHS